MVMSLLSFFRKKVKYMVNVYHYYQRNVRTGTTREVYYGTGDEPRTIEYLRDDRPARRPSQPAWQTGEVTMTPGSFMGAAGIVPSVEDISEQKELKITPRSRAAP